MFLNAGRVHCYVFVRISISISGLHRTAVCKTYLDRSVLVNNFLIPVQEDVATGAVINGERGLVQLGLKSLFDISVYKKSLSSECTAIVELLQLHIVSTNLAPGSEKGAMKEELLSNSSWSHVWKELRSYLLKDC